jgi:hypothetical protein
MDLLRNGRRLLKAALRRVDLAWVGLALPGLCRRALKGREEHRSPKEQGSCSDFEPAEGHLRFIGRIAIEGWEYGIRFAAGLLWS